MPITVTINQTDPTGGLYKTKYKLVAYETNENIIKGTPVIIDADTPSLETQLVLGVYDCFILVQGTYKSLDSKINVDESVPSTVTLNELLLNYKYTEPTE